MNWMIGITGIPIDLKRDYQPDQSHAQTNQVDINSQRPEQ